MRLIEADALIDAINQWMPNQEEFMESTIPPIENLAVSVLLTIEEQPTIDAIPVSWIKERIENAIKAKQTLIAQMWLELIDGYMREKNDTKRDR